MGLLKNEIAISLVRELAETINIDLQFGHRGVLGEKSRCGDSISLPRIWTFILCDHLEGTQPRANTLTTYRHAPYSYRCPYSGTSFVRRSWLRVLHRIPSWPYNGHARTCVKNPKHLHRNAHSKRLAGQFIVSERCQLSVWHTLPHCQISYCSTIQINRFLMQAERGAHMSVINTGYYDCTGIRILDGTGSWMGCGVVEATEQVRQWAFI